MGRAVTTPPRETAETSLEVCVTDGLVANTELDALGCIDLESGAMLGVCVRDEHARQALDLAAQAAAQICFGPRLGSLDDEEGRTCEALVVSESKIHLFALSKRRPDLVIVGVAQRSANLGLLLASMRSLAATPGFEGTR